MRLMLLLRVTLRWSVSSKSGVGKILDEISQLDHRAVAEGEAIVFCEFLSEKSSGAHLHEQFAAQDEGDRIVKPQSESFICFSESVV